MKRIDNIQFEYFLKKEGIFEEFASELYSYCALGIYQYYYRTMPKHN